MLVRCQVPILCAPEPHAHAFFIDARLVGGRQADFSTSVDNEWLCLRLLEAYGIPTAQADIATFGKQRVLIVERFDRQVSADGTRLSRLVKEDFCRATGTSPLSKYENEGGLGLTQLSTLAQQSLDAERDLRTLMVCQILFFAEPLLQDLIARTPEVVSPVQAQLPPGFSQPVADKVLGGLLDAARTLDLVKPGQGHAFTVRAFRATA